MIENMISRIHENVLVGSVILLVPKGKDADEQENRENSQKEAVPIGYLGIGSDLVPEHMHPQDIEIGIALKEHYRCKGYGTEAINWAIDWAFRNANMRRVSINCYEHNTSAETYIRSWGSWKREGDERRLTTI